MAGTHGTQVAALRAAVVKISTDDGVRLVDELEAAASLTLSWVAYLRQWRLTGVADELVNGMQSAVIEAAARLSLGMVRPAIFSIRAQIDMCLSWLYFKDHKIEWERVQADGDGFKLRKEAVLYLEQHIPKFRARFALLENAKRGRSEDPYRLLSAHVHSQSVPTVPGASDLAAIVRPEKVCRECVEIQRDASEYISDLFLSAAADIWPDLPEAVEADVKARLNPSEQSQLFA